MKASFKVSLTVAVAATLVLVLLIGASMGSAAAPNPALSNDVVLIANGGVGGVSGTGNVKVVDVDAMAVVNTIAKHTDGSGLANNHGVLVDGSGRYIYNTNNALASGKTRVIKYDLLTMSPVAVFDGASADQYAFASGACGIEWNYNDPSTNKMWITSMSSGTGNGGLYEVDGDTGFTGNFVDNTVGADSGATCGIGWNADGSMAYAAAIQAMKTTEVAWPGSTLGRTAQSTTVLHMLDVAKADNIAYVTAGKDAANNGFVDIVDLNSMTIVNHLLTGNPSQPHDAKVSGGFMYVHSRYGGPGGTTGAAGLLLVYDIGGGTAGGTKTAPVLIASIPNEGSSGVSCGTQLLAKNSYIGQPSLNLSTTGSTWGSYANYLARLLTVNYNVSNSGSVGAVNTTVVGSSSTNGVTLASTTPLAIGGIAAGGSASVSLQYNVPPTAAGFTTTTYATAGDLAGTTYAYPGPYPGS